jgi:hypothetical protein
MQFEPSSNVHRNHVPIVLWIMLIAMVTVVLAGSALATSELTGKGYWTQTKYDEAYTGIYPDNHDIISSQVKTTSVAFGVNYYPVTYDANNDGYTEIFGSNANLIKAWVIDSGFNLLLTGEFNSGLPQSGQMNVVNTSDGIRIVGLRGGLIYQFKYDTNVVLTGKLNYTSAGCAQLKSDIRCTDFFGSPKCLYMCSNPSLNQTIWSYDVATNTTSIISSKFQSSYLPVGGQIALQDWDNDGNLEIGYVCSYNSWNDAICVVETTTSNREIAATQGTSSYVARFISDFAFYNIDGIGFSNIVVSVGGYTSSWYSDCFINAYDISGAQVFTVNTHVNGGPTTCSAGKLMLGKGFTTTSKRQVCYQVGGNAPNMIHCYNFDNSSEIWSATTGSSFWKGSEPLFTLDADGDGRYDIVTTDRVIMPDSNTNFTFKTNTGGYMIWSDLTQDGLGELVSQSAGKTYVTFFTQPISYNYTIQVQDLDSAVQLSGAIVKVKDIGTYTTDNLGRISFRSNQTSFFINVTKASYNDWTEYSQVLISSPSINNIYLKKVLYVNTVLDSMYQVTYFENFSDYYSDTLYPPVSYIGYHPSSVGVYYFLENDLIPYNSALFGLGQGSDLGSVLVLNTTVETYYFAHDTMTTSNKNMFYFRMKNAQCDFCETNKTKYSLQNVQWAFVMSPDDKIQAAVAMVARYAVPNYYNEVYVYNRNVSQKIVLGTTNLGNLLYSNMTAWFNYTVAYRYIDFKITNDDGVWNVYAATEDEGPINHGYVSSMPHQGIINNHVAAQFMPSKLAFIGHNAGVDVNNVSYLGWIDMVTAADMISGSCLGNQPPTITNIGYGTGMPICVNNIELYSLSLADPENDYVSIRWDCTGEGSWSPWTIFTPSGSSYQFQCNYTQLGAFTAKFEITDVCRYPLSTGTDYTFPVSVTNSNCFNTLEGGGSSSQESTYLGGFIYNFTDTIDGYQSTTFDMSQCNSWKSGVAVLFIWACPLYALIVNIGSSIFDWVFSIYFGIFLMLVLVVIIIVAVRHKRG